MGKAVWMRFIGKKQNRRGTKGKKVHNGKGDIMLEKR